MAGAAAFVLIALAAGAAGGLAHGAVSAAAAGPLLDEMIAGEEGMDDPGVPRDALSGYGEYRQWQKGGHMLAAVAAGASYGALLGIVYALSRGSLPGGGDVGKALALGGMMFVVLFAVPFLKYPASPPGVGDPGGADARAAAFLALMAASGASALAMHRVSGRLPGASKLAALAGYGALVAAAAAALPPPPDASAVPDGLLAGFRASSVLGAAAFWAVAPAVLGLLWRRLGPEWRLRQRAG